MRERPACRRLASITAVAAGLWMAGCATTEAEGEGQPDLVTGIATIAGQIIGGVLLGVASTLGSQPEGEYAYRSPTYSTRAYTQTYAQPARPQHSHHHHNHSHRRR
jgi:hypothetical protein